VIHMPHILSLNLMSILIVVILIVSMVQGAVNGAKGSANKLLTLLVEAMITVAAIFFAWKWMGWSSPHLGSWLVARHIVIPNTNLNWLQQLYYSLITSVRDYSLLRSVMLFLLGYGIMKSLLMQFYYYMLKRFVIFHGHRRVEGNRNTWRSWIIGGLLGLITGVGRSLLIVAILFVYTVLFPHSAITNYIQDSHVYQQTAKEIIQPISGEFIRKQLPVFTKAVAKEFNHILQQKYEIVDADIPSNIAAAAKEITAGTATDKDKAKALYVWVGSQVAYDWHKANLYEQKGIWEEQKPEQTFTTKKGVCIDYARLYAVMARSVGLSVKVVTGVGYDGEGGYGPHAWNEVYLTEGNRWVPLDCTWYSTGGNWFNPPNFKETHIQST